MIKPEYAVEMAEYNQWMNKKLYGAASRLNDEDRRADNGAFFKSIHATLSHLIWGDSIWMSRFTENPAYAISHDLLSIYSFVELTRTRYKIDNEILQWAGRVEDKWLSLDFTWTSAMYQKTFTRPTWLLVMQMFNHQTHHRGQVTTLLSQYGVDVGVTDLPMTPKFESYGDY